MLGLIKNDFYVILKQGKILLALFIFFVAFGIISNDPTLFLVYLLIYASLLPLTAMAYSEKNHCDKLFLCMPLTRKQLVTSRYLFSFLLTGIALFIAILFDALIFRHLKEDLFFLLLIFSACIIYFSICCPVALLYGVEKSRYVMLAILFIPTLLGSFLSKSDLPIPFLEILQGISMPVLSLFTLLAASLVCLISWLLAVRAYDKKTL